MKWRVLILVLLLLFVPSVNASTTSKSGTIKRLVSTNTTFTMGSDQTFYRSIINSTHWIVDQSYSSKHYTRFIFSVASPSNTAWTINSFFQTKDGSGQTTATLMLTSGSNVAFSLYSPNLDAIVTVAGVTSYSLSGSTISMAASATANIIITLTVTETEENLATPENVEVTITNMDATNWLFSETKYYTFRALYWDGDGYDDLNTMKIAFTDEINWINASYSTGFSLDCGSDQAQLQGTTTVIDTNELQVDFQIRLTSNIIDTQDVEIYMYCIDDSGTYDGWEVLQTNYFNIYNVGGHVTYQSSGSAGRIEGGDWNNLYAETNSWAKASIVFRNLKYVDAIFSLDSYGNLSETEDDDEANQTKYMKRKGYFYFGIDYNINGTWIDGWYVRLELLDIDRGGGWPVSCPANWAVFNATWWYQGSLMRYDYVVCWYEGIETDDYRDTQRFHVRLWFNKANASTVVGGWVNEVFYGWTASGNWMLSGSAGAKHDAQNAANAEAKDSFLFTDLVDSNGNITSSTQIDLVRFWLKVERNNDEYGYIYKIKATEMLNFHIGNDMYGVDTPSPIEPTLPSEAQSGGILGWLGNVLSGFFVAIANFFGPAILGFWNTFVGFVDSIFTALGWPNGFSEIINLISQFLGWIPTAISGLINILIAIFSIITGVVSTAVSYFTSFVDALFAVYNGLVWIWESVLPYWGWIPGVLTQVAPLLFVLGVLWVFWPLIESVTYMRNFDRGIQGTIQRVQNTVGLMWKLGQFLWRIVDFAISLLYRLAELIPVAE